MPSTHVNVDQATGVLRDATGRTIADPYVLSPTSVELVGKTIATDPAKGLVLYRVTPPARTTTQITGLYDDLSSPWSGPHVTWRRSNCLGGALDVAVRSDTTLFKGVKYQTIGISGTTRAVTRRLTPAGHLSFLLPLLPRGGVCRVDFAISPTRRPGGSDPRTLGVHFDVLRYVRPTK
jgi:hypothetical protein